MDDAQPSGDASAEVAADANAVAKASDADAAEAAVASAAVASAAVAAEAVASAADSARRVSPEDIRASHADRDQVVDIIRDAAAEGRLTPQELDQRVESALVARTLRDLAALTRDLPDHPRRTDLPIPAKDVVRIEKRIGTVEWNGTWVVPRRMEIKLTVGNAKLDFTNAMIAQDRLILDVDLGIGGDLLLTTRPGIVVVANEVIVRMGELKIRPPRQDPNHPVDLLIEVTGRLRGGDLVVRYPRGSR